MILPDMSTDPPEATMSKLVHASPADVPDGLQRKLTEQRLRLLGTAVHATEEGIAILTPAVEAAGPRIAFVNDGFCSIYGLRRDEIIGTTPQILGVVERQQSIFDSLMQHVFEQRPFEGELTARRANGSEFELAVRLVPIDDSGELTHWVAFLRDVTAAKLEVTTLRHQAMHDSLTNLPNRTLLFDV